MAKQTKTTSKVVANTTIGGTPAIAAASLVGKVVAPQVKKIDEELLQAAGDVQAEQVVAVDAAPASVGFELAQAAGAAAGSTGAAAGAGAGAAGMSIGTIAAIGAGVAVAANASKSSSSTAAASTGTTGTTTPVAGQPFTLTKGTDTIDKYTGDANNNTFTAGDTAEGGAVGTTWTVGDAIDGGAGNDTFNIVSAAAITKPVATTVTNVETVNATSGSTITLNTSTGFTGLTALNTDSVGGATITGAGTTALSVKNTDAAATAEAIVVNGGSTVSVTSVNNKLDTITVGGTTAAKGAVNVTSSSITSAANGDTMGAITVTGGTSINVTQVAANQAATNVATIAGAVTVTGDATTTSVTVSDTKAQAGFTATTTVAGVIGHTNGAVAIADVNAGSATATNTISSVTLDSFAAATVNSAALTKLTLKGTGTSAAVTMGALTTPVVKTLDLYVDGLTTTGAVTTPTVTTLNIDSSGAASKIDSLVAAAATTINVSGNAALTLTANTIGAATAINVTNTAGASFGTALGADVAFTGGAGNDTVSLGATTKAITLGAGNDKVTSAGLVGTGGSVAAGDGTDTIVMTAANADAADASSVFNTKFTGFEVLELSDAMNVTVDLDGINAASKVVLAAGANGGTINNLVSGGTVQIKANNAGTLAIGVKGALAGASDVLNLQLSKTGVALTGNTITAANVETININVADAAAAPATGSAAVIHTLTLTAADATSVVVSGNNGLNLTATDSTKITNFDASGIVGNPTAATATQTATTDAAADLKVTYASLNATANAAVTIKGGAGDDVLTGSTAAVNVDTITGGEGADTITGGTGNDTIILTETTAAIDTYALTATATNGIDTVIGFAAGASGLDVVNLIDTETTVATNADATAVFASTTTAALTAGATAFALTGIATTTTASDVIEINTTLSSFGDLGKAGATSGTELLKALSSTDTASTGITLTTNSDDFYLIAYQNGNAYLYKVTDTADTTATASEIALVSVFQGVAAGAFASGDFIA